MGGFKWLDSAKFKLCKHDNDCLRGSVLAVDREYPKLHELHNSYPLAPDKLEIKKEILCDNQLKIVDYNIPTGSVKNLVPDFFDKEKYMLH